MPALPRNRPPAKPKGRQYYNPYGAYIPGFGYVPALGTPGAGATPSAPGTGAGATPYAGQYGYGGGLGSYWTPPATATTAPPAYYAQSNPYYNAYSGTWTPPGAPETGYSAAKGYQPWGQSLYDQLQGNYWGTRNQYGMSGLNVDLGQASGGQNWGAFNQYGTPMGGEVGSSLGAVGLTPFGGRRRANVYGVTPNPNNPAGYGSHPYSTHDRPSKTRYAESYNRNYPWMGTGGTAGGTTAPAWMLPMTMWRPG